jgi:hypothetical protein
METKGISVSGVSGWDRRGLLKERGGTDRVGGEAVQILASGSGNQFFKGKMVVSVGQIWIGKLKLLPCFKTLP